MLPLVDVILEDGRWQALALDRLAETAARATLARLGLPAQGFEIGLLATSDARIRTLNEEFRGKPVPTNVLSWPSEERRAEAEGGTPEPPLPGTLPDEPESLGDIAIAWETCTAEAEAAGRPTAAHATHLIVHATLHLLGYDHDRDGDATVMEGLEREILASLGLPDPYEGLAEVRLG